MTHIDRATEDELFTCAQIAQVSRRLAMGHLPGDESSSEDAVVEEDVEESGQQGWITAKEALDLLFASRRNAHDVLDGDNGVVGTALFSFLSLVNHSCDPTGSISFNGVSAELRALRHIQQGEEITISYIETAQPREVRQSELNKTYEFTCTCARCQGERDPGKGGGGVSTFIPKSMSRDTVESISTLPIEDVLRVKEQLEAHMSASKADNSYWRRKCLERLADHNIQCGEWQGAYQVQKQLLASWIR